MELYYFTCHTIPMAREDERQFVDKENVNVSTITTSATNNIIKDLAVAL
jgi:hypothetical protein